VEKADGPVDSRGQVFISAERNLPDLNGRGRRRSLIRAGRRHFSV